MGGEMGQDGVSDAAPERIGPYRILEQIGEGGFGVVYMAEQRSRSRARLR